MFEILRADFPRGRFHSVIFDFDGTLSLIREGWMGIMVPMMVDILRQTGTIEDDASLTAHVAEFVMRNNGRPTIYQMRQLAEEVEARGVAPLDPTAYLARFHELLMRLVDERCDAIASGRQSPEDWTVAGSREFLARLQERGLELYLASGTELPHVRREAELLKLTPFFGSRIYGPEHADDGFSKRAVIDAILEEHDLHGEQLLGFGDGFVEIEEMKKVGGVAVAVATDEQERGVISRWKRDRLVPAGADLVVPDYRDADRLMRFLFPE